LFDPESVSIPDPEQVQDPEPDPGPLFPSSDLVSYVKIVLGKIMKKNKSVPVWILV
jgi:hypothetical protein